MTLVYELAIGVVRNLC